MWQTDSRKENVHKTRGLYPRMEETRQYVTNTSSQRSCDSKSTADNTENFQQFDDADHSFEPSKTSNWNWTKAGANCGNMYPDKPKYTPEIGMEITAQIRGVIGSQYYANDRIEEYWRQQQAHETVTRLKPPMEVSLCGAGDFENEKGTDACSGSITDISNKVDLLDEIQMFGDTNAVIQTELHSEAHGDEECSPIQNMVNGDEGYQEIRKHLTAGEMYDDNASEGKINANNNVTADTSVSECISAAIESNSDTFLNEILVEVDSTPCTELSINGISIEELNHRVEKMENSVIDKIGHDEVGNRDKSHLATSNKIRDGDETEIAGEFKMNTIVESELKNYETFSDTINSSVTNSMRVSETDLRNINSTESFGVEIIPNNNHIPVYDKIISPIENIKISESEKKYHSDIDYTPLKSISIEGSFAEYFPTKPSISSTPTVDHNSNTETIDSSRTEAVNDADIDICQRRHDLDDGDEDSCSFVSAEAEGDIDLENTFHVVETSASCSKTYILSHIDETHCDVDCTNSKIHSTSSVSTGTSPFNPNSLPCVEELSEGCEMSSMNGTNHSHLGEDETSESPDASSDSFASASSENSRPSGPCANDSATDAHVAMDGRSGPAQLLVHSDSNHYDGSGEDGEGVKERQREETNSQEAQGLDVEVCKVTNVKSHPLSALAEPWYPSNYTPACPRSGIHLQKL